MTAREVIRDWVLNPRPIKDGKFTGSPKRLSALGEPLVRLGERKAASVAKREADGRWTRTQERYARIACEVLEEEGWTVFR